LYNYSILTNTPGLLSLYLIQAEAVAVTTVTAADEEAAEAATVNGKEYHH
jgi:hypothetical protein